MQRIEQQRIIPIIVLDHPDQALPTADALLEAGLDIMEITFRTEAAEEAIRRLAVERPQLLLGAGTVLTPDDARRAAGAGARFVVAPGLNVAVVQAAQDAGLVVNPGVMTPSDVEQALALECRLLKFFPAEAAGGLAMLKALYGPYRHTGIRFLPTGGIHAGNMGDYLAHPAVAAIGGSWIAERRLIRDADWSEITQRARDALAMVPATP